MARLLFASHGLPGVGGSSTAGYDLFRRMSLEGRDVHFLNVVDASKAAFFECTFGPEGGNPHGLPNVQTSWLTRPASQPQPELAALVESVDPDLVVGFGFTPAARLKHAVPDRRTVLVTGSCRQAKDHVTTGRARDAASLVRSLAAARTTPVILHEGERRAVDACELVITNSPLTLDLMRLFYPDSLGRIYPEVCWFVEWICEGARTWAQRARPFEERDIDVLFVASSWERREKNFPLVAALARRLPRGSVHLVGEALRPPPSVTHHGFIPGREALFELLGRARCVVCPSLIDAAPGVLFEASILGCNVVASRNCGNWAMCHPELLADPFELERLEQCISLALTRKYPDGLDGLLASGSYARFVRVLEAFARPFASRQAS